MEPRQSHRPRAVQLDEWLFATGAATVGAADSHLRPFREAVAFLCLPDKPARSLRTLQNETCPRLGAPQLYRLASLFHDEKHGTRTVSKAVLAQMRSTLEARALTRPHACVYTPRSAGCAADVARRMQEQATSIAPTSYLIPDPTKGAFMPDLADYDDAPELYDGLAVPATLRRYVDKRQREAFAFLEQPLVLRGAR